MKTKELPANGIAQVQQALKVQGFDPGIVDNKMGPRTKTALIKFQEKQGLWNLLRLIKPIIVQNYGKHA